MRKRMHGLASAFLREQDGAYIIEFGLVFPTLIFLSFGLLEFSLIAFDYQRAAEATRRGVRRAIVQVSMIPNLASLLVGTKIVCNGVDAATVSCSGASLDPNAGTNFSSLLTEMQAAYPKIVATNVQITYQGTDVGTTGTAGGIIPLITVRLINVKHDLLLGGAWGMKSMNYPTFEATVLGHGRAVNAP